MADESLTISSWWRQLDTAIASTNFRNLAQLSTTRGPSSGRLEGRPACRTVVILRVSNHELFFGCDMRSNKVNDVVHGGSEHAELCWYFADVDIQFRFSGKLCVHRGDSVSNDIWDEMPREQRKFWGGPRPGAVWKGDVQFVISEVKPEYFCVCSMSPDYVDLSDFRRVPFRREIHELTTKDEESRWEATRVYA